MVNVNTELWAFTDVLVKQLNLSLDTGSFNKQNRGVASPKLERKNTSQKQLILMNYRPASISDIPELVKLRLQFLNEIAKIANGDENYLSSKLYEYFDKGLSSGQFINWLAIDDEKIVATGGICFNDYPPSYEVRSIQRAYIMNVYTVKTHRNRSIASIIFKKLIDEAYLRNVAYITLHATEMGKPLYERFGFKENSGEMSLTCAPGVNYCL